jgi:hypothetical protein
MTTEKYTFASIKNSMEYLDLNWSNCELIEFWIGQTIARKCQFIKHFYYIPVFKKIILIECMK